MTECERDALTADAEAIGRRAAIKLAHRYAKASSVLEDFFETVAAFVEAEVRSAAGGPQGRGDVVLRLSYDEAVTATTAIVEADREGRSASEEDTLAELRRKFFSALGIRLSVSRVDKSRLV